MTGPMCPRNDDLRDALKRAASRSRRTGRSSRWRAATRYGCTAARNPCTTWTSSSRSTDTEAAALTLEKAGFRIERTPEDWLFKACVEEDSSSTCCIDSTAYRSTRRRSVAEEIDVLAIRMPVLPPTQ